MLRGQCEENQFHKGEVNVKKILALILCVAMMLTLAACNSAPVTEEFTPVTDGETIGEGSKTFPLVITDKDGNTVNVTVNTDEETVGGALLALGLIEGEDGDYGLYVKSVNGIIADYEVDATYWAFYINGEYAMTGVDQTPIADGETYSLIVEG